MIYVRRSGSAIVGLFARPQPGATELLDDDAADVVAFRAAAADPRVPCTPLYCAREILTPQEMAGLLTAAESSLSLKLFLWQFGAAQQVLPADPALSAGLTALVGAGLFTAQRRLDILAAVAQGMPSSWGQPA